MDVKKVARKSRMIQFRLNFCWKFRVPCGDASVMVTPEQEGSR